MDTANAARKRGRPATTSEEGGGASPTQSKEKKSSQPGLGSKSKPCMKFFSSTGCSFGEDCHFLHPMPGNLQTVVQMTGNNPEFPHPLKNLKASPVNDSPPVHKGPPLSNAKTRICNNYNTEEGCRFGDKCSFAHGERELRKPIALGGRLANNFNQRPPTNMATAPSFGVSTIATISIDASLVGAIIGKNGINTKQICQITGAKLSIKDHEFDPNVRNIELKGTFDQIKQASVMVRTLIVNVSSTAQTPARNLSYEADKNYKTKLCEKFAKGSCTYSERCRFAHGESQLRNSAT